MLRWDLVNNTSKIISLARSGRITCARKLFDEMPCRDLIAWNAMLTCYSQLVLHREALSFFDRMIITNIRPDHFSFTSALSMCAAACELEFGMRIHAAIVVTGYQSSLPVSNSLIDMYGKCWCPSSASKLFEEMNIRNQVTWCSLLFAHTNYGQFDVARQVFNIMPKKVTIAWNTMVAAHARIGETDSCFDLFRGMRESACGIDQWTFSALMNACTESSDFFFGCMVHALIVKTGWSSAVEAKNSILSFYAKLGCQEDVTMVCQSMDELTQVSWNAMIDAHMKVGDTHEALRSFQRAPERNVVSWTAMIAGYARNGNGENALSFFVDMVRNFLCPDAFAFGTVLHACSCLALLGCGRMVHGFLLLYGFHAYVYIGNGLVNMYAKCGDIVGASRAFKNIIYKDIVSWNAMLFGFALHGQATSALQLYKDMTLSGTKPDKVTFIGLLMTCSHSGLIERGQKFFKSMESDYKLGYEIDHVSCMVDMLGRGGYLTEAKELAERYYRAVGPDARSFQTLLGAASAHRDIRLGPYLEEALKTGELQKDTNYVLLSNLYCTSGKWDEAEKIRNSMVCQGIKKMPGCSWIEVRNNLLAFVAGKNSHPYMEELYNILLFLENKTRNPCLIGSEY